MCHYTHNLNIGPRPTVWITAENKLCTVLIFGLIVLLFFTMLLYYYLVNITNWVQNYFVAMEGISLTEVFTYCYNE